MGPGPWPQNRLSRGHGPGDSGARAPWPMGHDVTCILWHVLCPMACPLPKPHGPGVSCGQNCRSRARILQGLCEVVATMPDLSTNVVILLLQCLLFVFLLSRFLLFDCLLLFFSLFYMHGCCQSRTAQARPATWSRVRA